jgi:hypothetical protein
MLLRGPGNTHERTLAALIVLNTDVEREELPANGNVFFAPEERKALPSRGPDGQSGPCPGLVGPLFGDG